jgi:hypothetical protein
LNPSAILSGVGQRTGKPMNTMKTNLIVLAATLGAVAVAALVLSFRSAVDADSLIGYGSVLALVGMAALEYRINWKRLFGR